MWKSRRQCEFSESHFLGNTISPTRRLNSLSKIVIYRYRANSMRAGGKNNYNILNSKKKIIRSKRKKTIFYKSNIFIKFAIKSFIPLKPGHLVLKNLIQEFATAT